MRSTCKVVREAIIAHVLDYFSLDELKDTIDSIRKNDMKRYPTIYHAARHMVEGGSFLCYTIDMDEFLNSLGININNKQYSDEQIFDRYCHLLARDIEWLLKKP